MNEGVKLVAGDVEQQLVDCFFNNSKNTSLIVNHHDIIKKDYGYKEVKTLNKRKVIIIDCKSSSINYIDDCRKMGYEPVAMELYVPPEKQAASRAAYDEAYRIMNVQDVPKRIISAPTYEQTLEMVREIDPVAIIPGSDIAVDWATRMARDLGLPGNDPELIEIFRNKDLCQAALAKNGIRSIRGKIVHSAEEALEFYREIGCRSVVVKPNSGAGSLGVYICDNEEQIVEGFNINASGVNFVTAASEEVLIQEYIDGVEYIVDTVSYNCVHKVTGVYVCSKTLVPGKARIYDTVETVDMNSDIVKELIDYIFKVDDAIGVQIGPVHSEVMVDDNGPVLIESNFRPCGGSMRGEWIEKILGNRETDISLLSYLDPDKFLADKRDVLVDGKYQGIQKFLQIGKELKVQRPLFHEKLKDLPGYEYSQDKGSNKIYPATIDLKTCGGNVVFAAPDIKTIMDSVNKIREIEKNNIESLFLLSEEE